MRRRPGGIGIVGLGIALPPRIVHPPADDRRQGIIDSGGAAAAPRERRFAEPDVVSSDLEIEASLAALASAGLAAADVELLVGYSQVPDEVAPSNHGIVAQRLGLGPPVAAFTLEAGCASALVHLNTAARLIAGDEPQRALLYQSCLVSRVLEPGTDAAVILGDGAAAQVLGRVDPALGWIDGIQHTRAEFSRSLVLGARDGRARWVDAGDRLVVLPRDPTVAVQVGARGAEFARETCGALLARCGYTAADVDFFVCPQATSWFTDACARAVGVREGRWLSDDEPFHRYGHLLAASPTLSLWVAWRQRLLRPGDLVLLYSPGVGFTLAATLLRWALPPPPPPAASRARPPGTAPAG